MQRQNQKQNHGARDPSTLTVAEKRALLFGGVGSVPVNTSALASPLSGGYSGASRTRDAANKKPPPAKPTRADASKPKATPPAVFSQAELDEDWDTSADTSKKVVQARQPVSLKQKAAIAAAVARREVSASTSSTAQTQPAPAVRQKKKPNDAFAKARLAIAKAKSPADVGESERGQSNRSTAVTTTTTATAKTKPSAAFVAARLALAKKQAPSDVAKLKDMSVADTAPPPATSSAPPPPPPPSSVAVASSAPTAGKTEDQQLQKIIAELFEKQRLFHQKMPEGVAKLEKLVALLPLEERDKYLAELEPFRDLGRVNPFEDQPTGNLTEDLKRIEAAMGWRNSKFMKLWLAIHHAIDSSTKVHANLQNLQGRLEADAKLKEQFIEIVPSVMQLQATIESPLKNLYLYVEMLKAIKKQLGEAGFDETDDNVELIAGLLKEHSDILAHVNKNRTPLDKLFNAKQVVYELCAKEASELSKTGGAQEAVSTNIANTLALAHFTVETNINNILGGAGAFEVLESTISLLDGVLDDYKDVRKQQPATWSGYFYGAATSAMSLFGAAQEVEDPVLRLEKAINELRLIALKSMDPDEVKRIAEKARADFAARADNDGFAKKNGYVR